MDAQCQSHFGNSVVADFHSEFAVVDLHGDSFLVFQDFR